jgi:L-amino acid dehydrogenase
VRGDLDDEVGVQCGRRRGHRVRLAAGYVPEAMYAAEARHGPWSHGVFRLTTLSNDGILIAMSHHPARRGPAGSQLSPSLGEAPARRGFLGGAVVAGAAGAARVLGGKTAQGVAAPLASAARTADVIVVGAGLSGLAAAWETTKAGHSVVVLEARDRIGGRMVRRPVIEGGWIDLGGQWVGPTQARIIALADELGVQRFESYHSGLSIFYWRGKRSTFSGSFPAVPTAALLDAKQALAKINRLSALVPPEAPWLTPGARELDGQTLLTWLEANTRTPFARFVLTQQALIGGSGAFEPAEASLLHFLYTNRQAPQAEAPETDLFHGAAGQIPALIKDKITGSIVLNSPVSKISSQARGVRITAAGHYQGRACIVAIPPYLAGQISYEPLLPVRRSQLTQRIPMGALMKVLAIYKEAWWRAEGLNGTAIGDRPTLGFAADSSPPCGRPGILASFIAGNRAVELSTASRAELRARILADLTAYYGRRANPPVDLIVAEWPAQQWTGGAFTAFLQPGTWTGYGQALREGIGPIEWAGTEVADRWSGYFDGAVRAGQEAATRILRQI